MARVRRSHFPSCRRPSRSPAAAPVLVGVVDEDKLADGYKEYQSAIGALDKRAQDLEAKIPAREYLNDAQGTRFDALIVLPTLTPAQTTELDGLVKIGTDNKAEYIGLVGKANRTDADTKRLQELQALSAKNTPNLQRLSQTLLELLRTQQDKVDKDYTDRANQVVIQVAGEKKMVAVLRKKSHRLVGGQLGHHRGRFEAAEPEISRTRFPLLERNPADSYVYARFFRSSAAPRFWQSCRWRGRRRAAAERLCRAELGHAQTGAARRCRCAREQTGRGRAFAVAGARPERRQR